MNLVEMAAASISVRLPDGRYVFRPWGAFGPCYLLTPRQRSIRAWIQLAFYGACFAAIWVHPPYPIDTAVLAGFAAFIVASHLLHWLYTFGLAKTDPPARLTPEQRRLALAGHTRAIGRPFVWIQLVCCTLFVIGGCWMALFLGEWLAGLASVALFGAGAVLAGWQLWLARRTSEKTN